ncbi:RNA polymerase sigma-54 factor [Massilia sp. Root133]|uniref:RNA polymerase sigma-54 factor n=1 Tax=Massilia cellulosiltytica TaxID=2683234 RepID=A0A7X3FWW5_9BURK|nr:MULTISPECIES: RNA polymerase factor sigma-54 [Telluria group]KQY13554.1 RNA polymerase sigma-54 factor [Massilia sp. Root133]KQZ47680.1 RNA polymerase sigma-54 factor [Massilia sp. Root1485]MVW58557.1 RNA polymerase factor sigma-54 [Telluria cellulosilytica]
MKQTLQLKTSQHLALTPQLQQSIRLLQLSTLELHQEIEQVLSENPLLERLDDPLDRSVRLLADGAINSAPASSQASEAPAAQGNGEEGGSAPAENANGEANDAGGEGGESGGEGGEDWGEYGRSSGSGGEDEDGRPQLEASPVTLREHLMEQVRLTCCAARDCALVELVVDALDDNGYLEEPLEDIHARLPEELEIEFDELRTALAMVQSMDPPGVGARSAAECLALQIRRMPGVPMVTRRMALVIVEKYLTWFAQREFNKLKKALDCDDEDLREAQAVIRQCNPHPGAAFASDVSDFVVPDVIVRRAKDGWSVLLNPEVMPRLRVNSLYASLMKQGKSETQMNAQLQEAKWLIKNMRQRFDTILRVAQAIVDRQRNFFSHGAVAMRPLVLREIADTLGLHESTISRVTTQKYMLTPHGMFELKYFFGSHVATEAGGEASSTAIRALIVQLTGAEDPKNPLSDSKIAEMLGEQGMVIARRTVAKYREALKIPPVSLRKSL